MVFEPRVGGNIYDRGVDGSESRSARVLAYEPSIRLVSSWDIDGRRQIETGFEKTSEVEVRFTPETPDRTRVELEHRHLERHGDGWENHRDAVGSPTAGKAAFRPSPTASARSPTGAVGKQRNWNASALRVLGQSG